MILMWPDGFRGIPAKIPNPAKTARKRRACNYHTKIYNFHRQKDTLKNEVPKCKRPPRSSR